MREFDTTVSGIPCICRVTFYSPGTNRIITSQSLEPNDPEEFEYELLDRKGYAAAWLERKVTEQDEINLFEQYMEILRTEDEDYADPY